ncbi:MAG: class I SAM-dependent methyltransferase [Xanthomonadales bacterium]|nr:class I SAM-dependent methyltransferase [Xanthomonadales bacterium]
MMLIRKPPCHEDGHFYSPVVNTEDIAARFDAIWPSPAPDLLGIDWNDAFHLQVLREFFPRHIAGYDYPEVIERPPTPVVDAPAHEPVQADQAGDAALPAQDLAAKQVASDDAAAPVPGDESDGASEAQPAPQSEPGPEPEPEPEDAADLDVFYTRNSQFSWLDSRTLFVLLNEWAPKRMVEVGSGYSTLLSADVNRRFLGGAMALTCIEPYPRPFLAREGGLPGVTRLLQERVELVGMEPFLALQRGDILFIDSSHVAKTGSDVNFLFFEVLPRLAPGVRIHIHDIHLPHEYPPEWVIAENRSWNEQYLVRALLMYSTAFRVLFGCRYAIDRFPDLVRDALALPNGRAFGGGSLWIERV